MPQCRHRLQHCQSADGSKLLDQRRRRHCKHLERRQLHRAQIGIVHAPEANRQIKTFRDQIRVGRGGGQVNIQLRLLLTEHFQRRHHLRQSKFHGGGDAQRAL